MPSVSEGKTIGGWEVGDRGDDGRAETWGVGQHKCVVARGCDCGPVGSYVLSQRRRARQCVEVNGWVEKVFVYAQESVWAGGMSVGISVVVAAPMESEDCVVAGDSAAFSDEGEVGSMVVVDEPYAGVRVDGGDDLHVVCILVTADCDTQGAWSV